MIILVSSGIIIALLLYTGSHNAYACEVLSLPPIQEAYYNSAAIFSGRVVDFQKFNIEGIDRRVAFFEVDRYWKSLDGNDYKDLVVLTAIDHGACGFDFEIDKEYLVYADTVSRNSESLETSIGTRTQAIETAQEDLAFLGRGQVPSNELTWKEQLSGFQALPIKTDQETQIPMTLPIVGIGAVIAGTIAFFALRKRK